MSPLEAAALVAAGLAIGVYATAIGAGGGFLFAPLLLVRHPAAEPEFITAASLSVVAVSSLLSSVAVARQRRVDYPVVGVLALAAAPGALLGAAGTALLPREVFALGVSVLLLLLAVFLAWRPVPAMVDPVTRGWRRTLTDRDGNRYAYRMPLLRGIVPTAAAGALAGLAGIGGGVMYVPLATRVLRMPHALAVPAAHLVIGAIALTVVTFHMLAGHAAEPMRDVAWLALGVAVANPFGQRLNRRLGQGPLTRLLAVGLLLVSLRTAWGAL